MDLGVLPCTGLQDGRGTQLIPSMDDGDIIHKACQIQALVDGAISASHDENAFATVEKRIARGAVGYTVPGELLLARYAKLAWRCACAYDQAPCLKLGSIGADRKRVGAKVHGCGFLIRDLRPKTLCLLCHQAR